MQGAVRAPHTVATGSIQELCTVYIETAGSEIPAFKYRGYGVHVFVRNTPASLRITQTAAERYGVMLLPLVEEGQFLAVAHTELGRAEFLLYLDKQTIKLPRHACERCQESLRPEQHGPRRLCQHNRHKPAETGRLLIAVEFVIGGASVRPVATGAGGKEGARYHPLYARDNVGRSVRDPYSDPSGPGLQGLTCEQYQRITGHSCPAPRKQGVPETLNLSVPLARFLGGFRFEGRKGDTFRPKQR